MKKIIINIMLLMAFINHSYADKLSDIKEKGYITVGIQNELKPFNYLNRSGSRVGFDIDLVKFIAKELNVKVKFKTMNFEDLLSAINKNKIDIAISSILHKISRDKDVDFSITYLYDGQSLMSNEKSKLTSYKDLEGKKVAALKSSNSGKVFEVIQPLCEVVYFKSEKLMLKALKDKEVDAVTHDYTALLNTIKRSDNNFKIIGKSFTIKPYAIALKENESNLRDEVNFAIQNAVKTLEFEKIHKKWFRKAPNKNPILWP